MIAPRVAVDNPDKVNDIVLMGESLTDMRDLLYFQIVENPLRYVEKVLDPDHRGQLSVKEASKDSIFQSLVGDNLTHLLVQTNVTDYQNKSTAEPPQPTSRVINQDIINIEDVLEPTLFSAYENVTLPTPSALSAKCPEGVLYGYFEWNGGLERMSYVDDMSFRFGKTLSMIGNVSSDIGILILQGENDSASPVEQGLLLQQRLTEVNHLTIFLLPIQILDIAFFPSSEWETISGPIEDYVLEDIFEWLVSPARGLREIES